FYLLDPDGYELAAWSEGGAEPRSRRAGHQARRGMARFRSASHSLSMPQLARLSGGRFQTSMLFGIEEGAHLLHIAEPSRLTRKDEVIAAFERHESGVGDRVRQRQSVVEWDRRVAAAVQHECGSGDARQQVGDINVAPCLHHANGVLGRGGYS